MKPKRLIIISILCVPATIMLSCHPAGPGPGEDTTSPPSSTRLEGFGASSTGGAGGDVYRVTSLEDGGAGTLRDGIINRSGPRVIVFDVAGTITLRSSVSIGMPNLTIDGSTAPFPGITIKQSRATDQFVVGGTHDVIVSHLRFWGVYVPGGPVGNDRATISIDGDTRPDRVAQRIVLDHITSRNAVDGGPDLWGDVRDVSVSWCLFYESLHPTTISGPQSRQRISMHHNVYARNGERNPQLRGDVDDFDYVNNVIYDWGLRGGEQGGYGVRIRNGVTEGPEGTEGSGGQVHANLVNNVFVPRSGYPAWALVYGERPGPDPGEGQRPETALPQGTVLTSTRMGRLWVSGNVLPSENQDHYSTVSGPNAIPGPNQVTTWPTAELGARMLPSVGMKDRSPEEEALIDEIAAAMRDLR